MRLKDFYLSQSVVITCLLFFSGCSSIETITNKANAINLEENLQKAENYIKEGNYEESIKIYNNLYSKTNETKYLDEIDNIKKEQDIINVIVNFRSTLKNIVEEDVRKGVDIDIHDLKVVTEDLIAKMDEFDNLQINKNCFAFEFVNNVKNSDSYTFLNKFTRNEYENFLRDPLEPLTDPGFLANNLTISIFRDDIYAVYIPEILQLEVPDAIKR
jgi:hypothetical protein